MKEQALDNYKKELKFYAEKLAYTYFANQDFPPLSQKGLTVDNIKKFNVVFFFTQKNNKKEKLFTIELTVRYSINFEIPIGGKTSYEEATFTCLSSFFQNAIIEKVYNPEFGSFQHYNFDFGKPNPIQLYDAEFVLEEKLGIENYEE